MPNYCTADQAVALAGDPDITTSFIQDDWLNWVDSQIEVYTGQGYKGSTRTLEVYGDGTALLRLPSKAASITSIYENGATDPMPTAWYRLSGKRFIERLNEGASYSWLYYSRTWKWFEGWLYQVTYVEPTEVPREYEFAAAECTRLIAQWVKKNGSYGIALTASDAGSAGKVSTAASTSFPANLMEEIHRTIQRAIRKPGI